MVSGEAETRQVSDATRLGEWTSVSMLSAFCSLYYCEHDGLPESIINAASEDMVSFFLKLASIAGTYTDSQLRSGVVFQDKLCGYPYALEVSYSGTAANPVFRIRMYILPTSGKITVK